MTRLLFDCPVCHSPISRGDEEEFEAYVVRVLTHCPPKEAPSP